ncbi:MAG TPA: response regulator [Candidatus Mediterraneibacter norfolkensis]|nr:response regulator [Candidatus Mediterraneibacter norfolkensis]
MYSILLVEDEILELETLKNYVDWKKLGIDKVYTARSSRSALACIAEHEPDIMITDIQMPGMTGIELAKTVREEGYPCKIIFLTGYDKFEYAKAAVQIHAEDYLLKPFQIDEVEELIRQVTEKIRKERETECAVESLTGKAVEDLCMGRVREVPAALQGYFRKNPRGVGLCAVYGLEENAEQRLLASPEVVHGFTAENLFITLVSSQVLIRQFITKVLESTEDDIRGIYVERPVGLPELTTCTADILRYRDVLFFGERRKFWELREAAQWNVPSGTVFKTSRKEIVEAIVNGEKEQSAELLKTYLREYQCAGKEGCIRGAYGLFIYLKEHLNEETSSEPSIREKLMKVKDPELLECGTYDEMEESFLEYVLSCAEIFQDETYDYYISWVKQYVNRNYASDCSVEEMAEELGISPNYLRKKFKDGTGATILEYVTNVRMETAEKLLRQHRLKVKEVSLRVGYENVSYFTQLFAKRNGVTPNEYKNMVR